MNGGNAVFDMKKTTNEEKLYLSDNIAAQTKVRIKTMVSANLEEIAKDVDKRFPELRVKEMLTYKITKLALDMYSNAVSKKINNYQEK